MSTAQYDGSFRGNRTTVNKEHNNRDLSTKLNHNKTNRTQRDSYRMQVTNCVDISDTPPVIASGLIPTLQ